MQQQFGAFLKWLDYHLLLRLCGLLPDRLAYAGGRWRARYRCRVRHATREAARRHLQMCLPHLAEAALERHVLEFFYGPCLDELETYFLPGLTLPRLQQLMTIEGREHLDRCLERGRGAIVFSTHTAGVALCLVAFGLMGYRTTVIGRSLDEEDNPLHPAVRSYARRRVDWIVKLLGSPFLEPARGNTGIILQRLAANELVFILLDVPPEIVRRKVVARFLGRDCLFPSGFARIAAQTGCGLVPCERFYEPNWSHQKLIFRETVYASGNIEADVQRCVAIVEGMILRHPSQWYVWDNLPMLWAPEPENDGNPGQPAS